MEVDKVLRIQRSSLKCVRFGRIRKFWWAQGWTGCPIVYYGQPETAWPGQLPAPCQLTASREAGTFQSSLRQGTTPSPRQFRGRRGNVPSLETLGCFRDDVPKTQLHRVYLEILIGVEKLEKVAQGQGSTLTGQSPASAGRECLQDQ